MSALDDIRARNEAHKAEFTEPQYPPSVRDIDYLLDLLAPVAPAGMAPVDQLDVVGWVALANLGEASRVLDATGDVWFKLPDGRWSFKNVTTSSPQHLVQVFGPIRLLEETK